MLEMTAVMDGRGFCRTQIIMVNVLYRLCGAVQSFTRVPAMRRLQIIKSSHFNYVT